MERFSGIPLDRIPRYAKVPAKGEGDFYETVAETEGHPMTECIKRLEQADPKVESPGGICHNRLKEEGVEFPRPRNKKK